VIGVLPVRWPAMRGAEASRLFLSGLALLQTALCLVLVYLVWREFGLFTWVGYDFGNFWAGAVAFLRGGAAAVYQPAAVADAAAPLAGYYPGVPFARGPLSYPPVIMLAIAPFGWMPPVQAYLLWTGISLGLVVWVARRLAARGAARPLWPVIVLALTFQPVFDGLVQGQIAALLLVAVYRSYVAFEQGSEWRAGLWLGLLFVKPQYAPVLLMVLLIKGRWAAAAGMAATGGILAAISLALLGAGGLPVYLGSVAQFSGFREVSVSAATWLMISWRGPLVRFLPPSVSDAHGMLLVLALGLLTLSMLPLIWRGPWRPRSARFPAQFLATLIVTLLATTHSHAHGATLLLVPGLALLCRADAPRHLANLVRLGAPAPLLIMAATGRLDLATLTVTGLMLAALAAVVAPEARDLARSHVLPYLGLRPGALREGTRYGA
jgi:hypothetical protein